MGTAGFDASGVRGEENNWLCTRVLALLGRANVGVCVGECAFAWFAYKEVNVVDRCWRTEPELWSETKTPPCQRKRG